MAEASQGTVQWSNEDRYVSRMNLRHEKHLKKQLAALERERHMRTKSLQADKKNFEDRVHRLNMNPSDRVHLSQDTHTMIQADKNKELDRLLKSLMHRPYETRAGYSYIEYLSKNMQPLVNRPLQWGINRPLSPRRKAQQLQTEVHSKTEQKPNPFLTQVEGQPVSLTHRSTIPVKRREKSQLVLPPIVSTMNLSQRPPHEKISPTLTPRRLSPDKESLRILKQRRKSREKENQNVKKETKKIVPEEARQVSPQKDDSLEIKDKSSKTFVTMATLKVPSPTFPSFVEVPKSYDNIEDETEESAEQKLESQSQSYFAIYSRYKDRRKSI